MNYIPSGSIKVFPSAYRGTYVKDNVTQQCDSESFLMSEENIANIGNKITYTKQNYFYHDGNTIYIVLKGYLFVVDKSVFGTITSTTNIYVGIHIDDVASSYGDLISTLSPIGETGANILDGTIQGLEGSRFKGLVWDTEVISDTSVDAKIQIIKNGNWNTRDMLNISTTQISNGTSDNAEAIDKEFTTEALITDVLAAITIHSSSLNASQAVSTDANKNLVSSDLSNPSITSDGNGLTFISEVNQTSTGKVSVKTKSVENTSPTFSGVKISGQTGNRALSLDANKNVASVDLTLGSSDITDGTSGTKYVDSISQTSKGKVTYTTSTISNATTSAAGLMSKSDKTKLNGIESGAEVNVQSDWNEATDTSDAFIKNKPTIGNGTITIKQTGNTDQTFTVNQTGDTTITLSDNNTTYSAGTGLNLDASNKFNVNNIQSFDLVHTNYLQVYPQGDSNLSDKVFFHTGTYRGVAISCSDGNANTGDASIRFGRVALSTGNCPCISPASTGTAGNQIYFYSSLIPTGNNEFIFGNSTHLWSSIYASNFLAGSDRRLKENIEDYTPSKSILDLPIRQFDFKSDGSHHIGCIAQELQEIAPELVHNDEDGYLTIEETKLVYLLLDEVKKLRKELDELKGEK